MARSFRAYLRASGCRPYHSPRACTWHEAIERISLLFGTEHMHPRGSLPLLRVLSELSASLVSMSCGRRDTADGSVANTVTDPNSRLGLLVAGYEKALQDLLTQIITYWQACPLRAASWPTWAECHAMLACWCEVAWLSRTRCCSARPRCCGSVCNARTPGRTHKQFARIGKSRTALANTAGLLFVTASSTKILASV